MFLSRNQNGFQQIIRRTFQEKETNPYKHEEHVLESPKKIYQYKTVLLGESAVGKSCLAVRFVSKFFNKYEESTVGAAFLTKTIQFPNYNVKFDIWDTAGAENFHVITPLFYTRAQAVILVYDITNRESFERIHYWIRELRMANAVTAVALVGNKTDMENERMVKYEEGFDLANSNDFLFLETSAKIGYNVEELFENLAVKLVVVEGKYEEKLDEEENEISESCCCGLF